MTEDDLWTVSEEQKLRFAGLYLLEHMVNHPQVFEVWLERNDRDLEPVLEWLLVKGWISIREDKEYIPNEQGREILKKFMERYAKFVYFFDVFSAVDLGAGTFAFERYFDYLDEQAFQAYLNEDHFEDLRVAVAEYLDIDAVEIVFMSYIREGRFGKDAAGWQFDLLLGKIWDEIVDICNEATDVSDLGYEADEGFIAGEAVMQDILNQGAQLLGKLLASAESILQEETMSQGGEEQNRVVEPVTFPSATEFDFATYTKPKPDPFWDSDWEEIPTK